MPPIRRTNIGRRTRNTRNCDHIRYNQTQEERAEANELRRAHNTQAHAAQTSPQIRQHVNIRRRSSDIALNRAAFEYDSAVAYKDLLCVDIGSLSIVCQHCKALKFRLETPGLCCAGGKVKLPVLAQPPEPLYSFLYGNTIQSKHSLANTQKYNGSFQMTSFGAEVVEQPGYNPSYKIQGQIHHRAGALLPQPNEDHKFIQIYFVGNSENELEQWCAIFPANKREMIGQLQILLHEHNELVRLFKTALDTMHSDDHKIIIRADKRPSGSYVRQFNAPTINEAAVVIVGENLASRDIVAISVVTSSSYGILRV
ncbi:uncharacterized protein LOC107884780 [Acyrthosiphon pisum]|uniref:Helitron helicase-like domain-containing protein n=1 Tax=Acyrthosiphon pisum TaxID=7029 RepID=A0A8R2H8E2_ACYPI|nr:uncharacterized protein LOC107884780 [Acyrthosiphon pisum]|eukprot:XP_016663080.1 PREDICTED: uncharacterized protein LOC107884780 [Acyrthosiphon pisum]